MKSFLGLMVFLGLVVGPQVQASDRTDTQGVSCDVRVEEVVRKFFDVMDLGSRASFGTVGPKDRLEVIAYKSLTPGSWDQKFLAEVMIFLDPAANKGLPTNFKAQFVLTGDYDCDYLKVRSFKEVQLKRIPVERENELDGLGGVERVD